MSIENLNDLRKKVAEAVKFGILNEDSKSLYEATLIQIINEAEMGRQRCINLCEQYKRQAAAAEAQAGAYSQMGSVVFSILNGFVSKAEKNIEEEQELKNEKEELSNSEIAKIEDLKIKQSLSNKDIETIQKSLEKTKNKNRK